MSKNRGKYAMRAAQLDAERAQRATEGGGRIPEGEYAKMAAKLDAERAQRATEGGNVIPDEYALMAAKLDAEQAQRATELAAEANANEYANNVVVLRPRKAKTIGPKLDGKSPLHMLVGSTVLHVLKNVRGEDIMFTEKAAYRYADGIWSMETDGMAF